MISHSFLLFLGLCQAVILPSKNLQAFVSGFNIPHDLTKVKMVDKSWIDVEKVYTLINPEDGPLVHKETNQIFLIFSNYIGVKTNPEWVAQRWSVLENKSFSNGKFDNEETAAHASDTLARDLMNNGEHCHMLNFPDDSTEVYGNNSGYFGVTYKGFSDGWRAYRWSENENKMVYSGCYNNEETAAHASDTLARELMNNGEHGHMLNFPDENIGLHVGQDGTCLSYLGIYQTIAGHRFKRWQAHRWNKDEARTVSNACCYKNEETAAHASDTLAKQLSRNGQQGHKFNFPEFDWSDQEIYPEIAMIFDPNFKELRKNRNKRKRYNDDFSQNN